jgi:hypothetical protein
MKLLHRVATSLDLSNHTLDDIARKAHCMGVNEVTVTALKGRYPMTEDRRLPGEYQPVVIIGEKRIKIGKPIDVDFNPVEGLAGPNDLRHRVIQGKQLVVEEILSDYVRVLQDLCLNAKYRDFDRTY